MIHSSVYDGGVNDILSSINPRVPYAQIYSPSAPVVSTNTLNGEIESLLKNRVEAPIVEAQDAVRNRLMKTIVEAKEYIEKTATSGNSLERKRYIDGVKESLNIMQSYVEEDECIYKIVEGIRDIINTNQQTYSKIVIKSKPFYAGLLSGLMNFLDLLMDEIRAKEMSETKISVNITRQINVPDKIYNQNNSISNISNDYRNSY